MWFWAARQRTVARGLASGAVAPIADILAGVAARASIVVAVALASGLAAPRAARADDRPETSHLVWAGVGMALPTYVVALVAHEGSHALTAELVGAEVTHVRLLPGINPRDGKFYFGYVGVRGLFDRGDRILFFLAPKLVDLAVLGSYGAAVLTGHTPDNAYGGLALAVLATGFWVDFSKDIPAFWRHSDIVKLYDAVGATTELRRLPLRVLHAGLSAAAAYAIVRGYQDVFDDDDDGAGAGGAVLVLPLALGSF